MGIMMSLGIFFAAFGVCEYIKDFVKGDWIERAFLAIMIVGIMIIYYLTETL